MFDWLGPFTTDDKVSSLVSKQLAETVNKCWASKLSENKLKELSEKYDRPKNCEKSKLSDLGKTDPQGKIARPQIVC